MAIAKEARVWARSALGGIGNSLYTPFCGDDGDDIDWDAYRTLVRYCVGELRHPMLWCTSGIAEFWSLTLDERKRLLEVAIEEGVPLIPMSSCRPAPRPCRPRIAWN
jgi:4-hydroxy-tetrahydrodipicolinate synthase